MGYTHKQTNLIDDNSISFVYEEDDPKKAPNRKMGELLMDK